MDTPGCSRDRNRRPLPESGVPRTDLAAGFGGSFATPGVKDQVRERGGGRRYKSVTMAPTSRYLSDRRYVARRPLVTADQQTSILKKPNPQDTRCEEVRGNRTLLPKATYK